MITNRVLKTAYTGPYTIQTTGDSYSETIETSGESITINGILQEDFIGLLHYNEPIGSINKRVEGCIWKR